ncbi:MAG: hypothetical protein Q7T20_15985 [Saprospiraceae bacterium]|nr:hypothetical protein [Saprospiraceae bacterium]
MSKRVSQSPASNPFKDAVEATPEVKECYQPGLQAFGTYSTKINLHDNRECNGSVEIDECVRVKYPNANRWDYVFAYKSTVYFVEVHSAETNEVSVVLAKLQWLKDWLNTKAPEIAKLKAQQPYYWIQSSRFSIPKTTRQYRLAAQNGILPISKLTLK